MWATGLDFGAGRHGRRARHDLRPVDKHLGLRLCQVHRSDQIEVVEALVLTEADVGLTDGDALTRIGDAADPAGKPGYPGFAAVFEGIDVALTPDPCPSPSSTS